MTDFAALVAELKDAALDAGATWDRCSDEFQKTLETRLHDAERALLAASSPPSAGAAGGSDVVSARLIPWEPGQKGVEITLTGGRSVAIPLSQYAGAAGGGSGDLVALTTTDPAPNAAASHATNFRTLSARATKKDFSRQDWFKCEFAVAELRRAGHEQSADAVLKAAMIADVPTPDLGAQGEPVAWAYDMIMRGIPNGAIATPQVSFTYPNSRIEFISNIRPLYERSPVARGEEADDLNGAPRKAPLAQPDEDAAELAASERISAAQIAYDEALQDYDPNEPEHEVRLFDAMKEAIAVADSLAPAAPRTGSGVSEEDVSAVLETHIRLAMRDMDEPADPDKPDIWIAGEIEAARAVHALIAQAPRDGGETQGGQTQASRDVLAERRRQVEAEGWTVEHDSTHRKGEMAIAAACYSKHAAAPPSVRHQLGRGFPPALWPWEDAWWKPIEGDRRRDLVKAGALILAEIERLDRATPPSGVETIRQDSEGATDA